MFLSLREKEARFKAVRHEMAQQGFDALIARGSSVGRDLSHYGKRQSTLE
ncbi:MAG TPA: hypothetical protein VMO00_00240 [Methylomirabilota bacterium]|nr:hypothetical protein [Methylomirabilota bacterium]